MKCKQIFKVQGGASFAGVILEGSVVEVVTGTRRPFHFLPLLPGCRDKKATSCISQSPLQLVF